jgi:hypothetical protein
LQTFSHTINCPQVRGTMSTTARHLSLSTATPIQHSPVAHILSNILTGTGLSRCCVFLTNLLCSFLMCPLLCPSFSEAPILCIFFSLSCYCPLGTDIFISVPPHFPQDERPKLTALQVNTVDHCSLCKLSGFHGCLSTDSLLFGFFTV